MTRRAPAQRPKCTESCRAPNVATSVFLLSLSALLCVTGTAHAEYQPNVVLLEPPVEDPVENEALARLKGELRASSFQLVVIPVESGLDPSLAVNTLGRALHPAAVFFVYRARSETDTAEHLEIWMADRASGRTFVQRQAIEGDNAPRAASVLAVQAVELLKARLADASLTLPPPADSAPPIPAPEPSPNPLPHLNPPRPAHSFTVGFATQAAVGLLSSFGATEVTWTPLVRISYGGLLFEESATPFGLSGRVSFAGFGSSAEVSAPNGTARLETSFALLEAVLSFAPAARIEPFISAAGGIARVSVEGRGETPYFGKSDEARSAFSGFGAGLALDALRPWSLIVEAQVLFAWSPVIVRLSTFETERIGLPLLALSTGLVAAF